MCCEIIFLVRISIAIAIVGRGTCFWIGDSLSSFRDLMLCSWHYHCHRASLASLKLTQVKITELGWLVKTAISDSIFLPGTTLFSLKSARAIRL